MAVLPKVTRGGPSHLALQLMECAISPSRARESGGSTVQLLGPDVDIRRYCEELVAVGRSTLNRSRSVLRRRTPDEMWVSDVILYDLSDPLRVPGPRDAPLEKLHCGATAAPLWKNHAGLTYDQSFEVRDLMFQGGMARTTRVSVDGALDELNIRKKTREYLRTWVPRGVGVADWAATGFGEPCPVATMACVMYELVTGDLTRCLPAIPVFLIPEELPGETEEEKLHARGVIRAAYELRRQKRHAAYFVSKDGGLLRELEFGPGLGPLNRAYANRVLKNGRRKIRMGGP